MHLGLPASLRYLDQRLVCSARFSMRCIGRAPFTVNALKCKPNAAIGMIGDRKRLITVGASLREELPKVFRSFGINGRKWITRFGIFENHVSVQPGFQTLRGPFITEESGKYPR